MDITKIKITIDEAIEFYEEKCNKKIPKENRKNSYLKACWLLARCNELSKKNLTDKQRSILIDNRNFLKEAMPKLKEAL